MPWQVFSSEWSDGGGRRIPKRVLFGGKSFPTRKAAVEAWGDTAPGRNDHAAFVKVGKTNPAKERKCDKCGGSGSSLLYPDDETQETRDRYKCKKCGGSGRIGSKRNVSGSFERCVKSVAARGGAADPRAVCAAAGRKKYGQAEMTRRAVAGKRRALRSNPKYAVGADGHTLAQFETQAEAFADARSEASSGRRVEVVWKAKDGSYKSKWFGRESRGRKNAAVRRNPMPARAAKLLEEQRALYAELKGRDTTSAWARPRVKRVQAIQRQLEKLSFESAHRSNPADAAAVAYEDFHGRAAGELVEVKETIHFHEHLAGAGALKRLVIKSARTGERVTLSQFKGALLAFNEAQTQLFVMGGDQAVDLGEFGITGTPHESEILGEVLSVDYFTRKDHLAARDGGTAVYRHKFEAPRPTMVYDVPNEQLQFSGGGYVVLPEGIDR